MMRITLPLLVVAFAVQVICALVAAIAVWQRRSSVAAIAIVLLGASIVFTALIEAFVLGTVAYMHALLVAVLALVAAFVLAGYVSRTAGA